MPSRQQSCRVATIMTSYPTVSGSMQKYYDPSRRICYTMGFIRAVRAGVAVVLMMSATVVQPRSSHAAPSAEETAVSCHALASNIGIPRSSIDANAVQQAVDEATAGATVKVAGACAGVQNRAGAFQTVYIDKIITLEGGYAPSNWTTSDPITNPTLLDALTNGRVIYATAAVTISNLTARNGNAPTGSGGGAYAFGSLTLNNAQFIGNSAQNNGGGAVALGEATLNGGLFQNNTSANGDGGGFYANSTFSLTGTQFLGNSA